MDLNEGVSMDGCSYFRSSFTFTEVREWSLQVVSRIVSTCVYQKNLFPYL